MVINVHSERLAKTRWGGDSSDRERDTLVLSASLLLEIAKVIPLRSMSEEKDFYDELLSFSDPAKLFFARTLSGAGTLRLLALLFRGDEYGDPRLDWTHARCDPGG
jgi:hypothetical protein